MHFESYNYNLSNRYNNIKIIGYFKVVVVLKVLKWLLIKACKSYSLFLSLNLANGSLSIKASNVCETEINGKKSKSVSNVKKVISLPKGTIESSIKADCKGHVLHLSGTIKK